MIQESAVLDRPMDKPKGRPKSSTRDDVVARVDREVVRQARYVADMKRISLAEYISEILKPVVAADYAKFLAEESRRLRGGQK